MRSPVYSNEYNTFFYALVLLLLFDIVMGLDAFGGVGTVERMIGQRGCQPRAVGGSGLAGNTIVRTIGSSSEEGHIDTHLCMARPMGSTEFSDEDPGLARASCEGLQ